MAVSRSDRRHDVVLLFFSMVKRTYLLDGMMVTPSFAEYLEDMRARYTARPEEERASDGV